MSNPARVAALRPDPSDAFVERGLLKARGERGSCRVVCFSPQHDLSLGELSQSAIETVIDTWAAETEELGRRFSWLQVFENRGPMMGASNPHPHGQIWATSSLPLEAVREHSAQADNWALKQRSLLLEYAAQEQHGPRVVSSEAEWLVVAPFWAVWPFETLLLPLRPVGRLADLDAA